MPLYTELADEIARRIEAGILRPGDRLPSVRRMCGARNVSKATVLQAYHLLEDRGFVRTRPRSGYFVNDGTRGKLEHSQSRPLTAADVATGDVLAQYLEGIRNPKLTPLGSAFASPELYPVRKLGRVVGDVARHIDPRRTVDDLPPGNACLRRHIAQRYLESGARVELDEIVITSGASEGLLLALAAVTRPGDTIAMESPCFYLGLHAAEQLGLRTVCIPVHPRDGLDLEALGAAIAREPIRAVWSMPNFQNPTGALMSVERKRELVALLARHAIPLIEDDAYAELFFGARPPPAKAFDRDGLVAHCGSFSKCLAPGYRVGWVAPGRYATQVRRDKFLHSIASNVVAQEAVCKFVSRGGYEHHLRRLRSAIRDQQSAMLCAIARHLPDDTTVTRPEGGYFLWLELPGEVDSLALNVLARDNGFSIAPGPLFSSNGDFKSHIRINCGHPWGPDAERAIVQLGRMIAQAARPRG